MAIVGGDLVEVVKIMKGFDKFDRETETRDKEYRRMAKKSPKEDIKKHFLTQ